MQSFSYHKQAEPLKGFVRMMQLLVSVDVVVLPFIGLLLPRPWNYVMYIATPFWLPFTWWLVAKPLRRRHTVSESVLTLVGDSSPSYTITRDQIQSVARFTSPLPRGVAPVATTYVAQEDTLYILPDKKNLVLITLESPAMGKVPLKGMVEFTRVVCVVDEPEAFIAALMPGAAAPDQEPAPPIEQGHARSLNGTNHTATADASAAIELRDLTKRFGDYKAVNSLSLQVAPGEVFAFLGSNGAGKSTTIKMMVGLLRPTSGQILIGGRDPWRELNARRQVGYVPDTPLLYENLTAQEHLWLIGGLYDLADAEARSRATELLQQLGLTRNVDQQVRSFSLGMKRKLAIASALMHRPTVLLLDEATNGLDPRAAREVKDFIGAAARAGTTIFLTTHLLDVVAELAHRVAIIDQGELQALGTMAELQAAAGRPDASLEELFLLATDQKGVSA